MDIPEYNMDSLKMAERDGEFYHTDFASFISQLIERDMVDDSTERGILAFVNDNGTEKLSDKQKFRLQKIVERYGREECKICGEKIPLDQVLDIDENDGLCSYHKHQMDKDD